MFGKPSFLDLEPSTMIHADSVSFLTSTSDDRIQKYSSMFGMCYYPSVRPSGLDNGQVTVPLRFDGPKRGRGPQKRKKEEANIQSFYQTSMVSKDLLYRKKKYVFLWDKTGSHELAR